MQTYPINVLTNVKTDRYTPVGSPFPAGQVGGTAWAATRCIRAMANPNGTAQ